MEEKQRVPWNKKYFTEAEKKAALTAHNAKYYQKYKDEHSRRMAETYNRQGWGYFIERKFNVSEARHKEILESQGNRCPICGRTPDDFTRRFAVDHDHDCCPNRTSCGKCVRGVLCGKCNSAISFLDDDPALLIKAAQYLMRGVRDRDAASIR